MAQSAEQSRRCADDSSGSNTGDLAKKPATLPRPLYRLESTGSSTADRPAPPSTTGRCEQGCGNATPTQRVCHGCSDPSPTTRGRLQPPGPNWISYVQGDYGPTTRDLQEGRRGDQGQSHHPSFYLEFPPRFASFATVVHGPLRRPGLTEGLRGPLCRESLRAHDLASARASGPQQL